MKMARLRLCVNSAGTEISSDRCAISPRGKRTIVLKNAFEWGLSGIPHSEDAIQVSQQIANFLVREARMSLNRPSYQEVLDNLIYNYTPTYCENLGISFYSVSMDSVDVK
ncbi:hypothetical protein SASPL_156062 [Salvia splendens]|uniref:Uncharacterized protein n=1 Tax=Salvia splendens TaxID=180675 RepID=A0A8X8VXC9_SALSN|nr:hypothetical protein SASPL_156062 [Salvia splendens]